MSIWRNIICACFGKKTSERSAPGSAYHTFADRAVKQRH